MRSTLGVMFAVTGMVALTAAATRYAQGALVADAARQAWEERTAHAAVASAREYASDHGGSPVSLGAPVAHLVIPKIGLDEIVLEGVDGEELNAAPGHLPGTPMPGQRGNAVISAHRDRHFKRFDQLEVGDTIATEWGGQSDRWGVTSIRVVDADAPALIRTSDPTLTLTTCWPIRYVGPAPQRLIVTAKPLGSPKQ